MRALDPALITGNRNALRRLQAPAGRLTAADLTRPLGDRWTASAAFAHLAFWDRRAALLLQRWQRGQVPPAGEPDWYGSELLNDALLLEWRPLPPGSAVRLALEAGEAVDWAVERLDVSVIAAIRTRDEVWLLRRGIHRSEHLDQIERTLAIG